MKRGLFDTGLARPAPPATDPKTGKPRGWTVTQLTRHIKDCIERGYQDVRVEGEISNFKAYGSGHVYFTLKDDGAQLPSVLFRANAALSRTRLWTSCAHVFARIWARLIDTGS